MIAVSAWLSALSSRVVDVSEKLIIGQALVKFFFLFGKMYDVASGLENCRPQLYCVFRWEGNKEGKMFCNEVGEIGCLEKTSVLLKVLSIRFLYSFGL